MDKFLRATKKIIPKRLFSALRLPYHFTLAFAGAFVHRFPSRSLFVIGVTGTKGKTTTVELIHEILRENGIQAASLSSLRFRIGDAVEKNERKMTMPGRFFVQSFLRRAVRHGCTYAVLEVPSEGIAQYRHRFIRFGMAVMTNIAPEHIESHGSFEAYLRAKLDLFWRLPKDAVAVINRDDAAAGRFVSATRARTVFYSKGGLDVFGKHNPVKDIRVASGGISFDVGQTEIYSPLLGEFNFYNILAAVTVGLLRHVVPERIARAVAKVRGVSGRMEFVQKEPFAVVVDYAHTPDSLKNVYTFLRESTKHQAPSTKLVCVLGAAGGGRDRWKRPEFGRIAAEFCREIILTDEDPYDENPATILNEIEAGFSSNSKSQNPNHKKILNRREAIREALRLAHEGDTVVITGKGAEPWMMGPNGTKTPWDDREVAREELQKIKK